MSRPGLDSAWALQRPRRRTPTGPGRRSSLFDAHGAVLRRVARRHSLGPEDADDALQRAAEILLTKAPSVEPNRLIAWMAVVTKHEALAVRRSRERLLDLSCTRRPA